MTVANKAQSIYATYLENSEKTKLALLYEVAERAGRAPGRPEGRQRLGCAGLQCARRYSQGISIAKALSQGLGAKVKTRSRRRSSFHPSMPTRTPLSVPFTRDHRQGRLAPQAHARCGKDAGLALQDRAEAQPGSAIAMVEYANGQCARGRQADEERPSCTRTRRRRSRWMR
jgi:hypothetical protein